MITFVMAFVLVVTVDSFHKEETLALDGTLGFADTLDGEAPTSTVEHLRFQQHLFGAGLDWTVTDPHSLSNSTLLYTKIDFSWLHNSGHTHTGKTDQVLAYFTDTFWAVRQIWEVRTYNNTCGVSSQDAHMNEKKPMHPFARMTKHFWTLYSHYTLERYDCHGSLVEVWDMAPRFWLSALHHWDVRESSTGRLLGTIDEMFSVLRRTYNAKVSPGEDKALFAHATILAESLRHWSRGGGSGSSSSNSGSGNLRGGGAAAAR
jgi:hypothetical protein